MLKDGPHSHEERPITKSGWLPIRPQVEPERKPSLVAKPRWRRAGRRKSGSRENCCASQHANPRTDWAWGNWSNGLGRAACGNGEKPGPADPVAGARPVQLPRFGRLASWTDWL